MQMYCLIPPDLAEELHDLLRSHFRHDPAIVVVVDRRWPGRHSSGHAEVARKTVGTNGGPPGESDRRQQGIDGRALLVDVDAQPRLPYRARRHAARIRFVEPVGVSAQCAEAQDITRLVTSARCGDAEAFGALYVRYFDRIYGYLRMTLRDRHDAEDLTQQVFLNALDHLDQQNQAFQPWLFRIARNLLVDHLRKKRPTLLEDPEHLPDRLGLDAPDAESVRSRLTWMSESEVARLIERLPTAQHQVIILRYLIGLTMEEIAEVLGRSLTSVRHLDHRARQNLRTRLIALGRGPVVRRRAGILRRPQQVHVLRERRWALLRR